MLASDSAQISLLASLVAAAGLGFFGSPHCIAMCGGITSAFDTMRLRSGPDGPSGRARASILPQLLYSCGRITSYSLAGALVGVGGLALGELAGPMGILALRTVFGAVMIALGLSLAGLWPGGGRLEATGATVWRRLSPLVSKARRLPDPLSPLLLGALWGFLPCGLVYGALAAAATSGSAWQSAAMMACFGLGTVPALVATGLVGQRMGAVARRASLRRSGGIMLMAFGAWTILGSIAMQPMHPHH